jgi:hypothetical protein
MLRCNPRLKNAQLPLGNPDLGTGLSIAFSAMLREIPLPSAEVLMARVMSAAATQAAAAEKQLLQQLKSLEDDWVVLRGPLIEAGDASIRAEFVLLNDRLGIVVAGAAPDRDGGIAKTADALAHMLEGRGVLRRVRGHVPIVALRLDGPLMRDPDPVLRRAFEVEAPLSAEPGWSRRVATLLAPEASPATQVTRGNLELRAERDEAWRVAREPPAFAAAHVDARVAPEDHVPAETVGKGGATLWAGMAIAFVLLGGVLAGMAALNYGGTAKAPVTTAVTPR